MLMAYFEENRLDERAHGILYNNFPEWFTWQPHDKKSGKEGSRNIRAR
jgi:hypothetical protein